MKLNTWSSIARFETKTAETGRELWVALGRQHLILASGVAIADADVDPDHAAHCCCGSYAAVVSEQGFEHTARAQTGSVPLRGIPHWT